MSRRPLFTLAVLALFAACGGESSSAQGADAADVTSETVTESRTAASNDRCAEARFEDTQPFAFHDDLPFRFEVPAEWDHLDSSNSVQLVGSVAFRGHTGRRSSVGLIQYAFGRDVVPSPDVILDMYRKSRELIGTVMIGGQKVEVFGHRNPAAITAKFLFPDRGGLRQASFMFGAASDACLPERERLRDLFLGSVADRS